MPIRNRRLILATLGLCLTASACFAQPVSAPLALPFHDAFQDGDLAKAGWTVSLSDGNKIIPANGLLSISAHGNTYAHIARPLEVDGFRATCSIRPDGTISWVPSLYIYWDEGNWAQVSCRGGSFAAAMPYAAIMEDGELFELFGLPDVDQSAMWPYSVGATTTIHRPAIAIGPNEPAQHFGIELAPNQLRFLVSEDGKQWTRFRTFPRTNPKLKQAPAMLVLGKGNSDPRSGTTGKLLKNDYKDRGGVVESQISDLSVVPVTEELEKSTKVATFEMNDRYGDAVLAKPEDPSFAAVDGIFPPMQYPREIVGVKDHPSDFGITPDGAIHHERGYVYFEVGSPAQRFGIDNDRPANKKTLYKGYMPIVQSRWDHDGVEYEQLVFGHTPDFSTDKPIHAFARLTLRNTSDEPRTVHVAARQARSSGELNDKGVPLAAWDVELPAKGERSVYIKAPFGNTDKLEQPTVGEFDALLSTVSAEWDRLLNAHMKIDVPEQSVADAYRAWLAWNFLDVDNVKGVFEPRDGSGFYDDVFGISAALYCRILDEYGYHEASRDYLTSLLTFIKPDGEFIVNYGLPDSGALLMALDEHYKTTRDEAWLKSVTPAIVKVSDYILRRHKVALDSQQKDSPFYGLIYERPYCDHPGPAYNFVADLNLAAGLFAAADSLNAAGQDAAAAHYRDEAQTYQKSILRGIEKSVIEVDGQKIIPMFPQTHKLLKAAEYTAADYYTLQCGQMLEKGLIDPYGWEAKAVVDMVEKRAGLTLGVCRFAGGIDHAYTYGYWFNCLQRGDARKPLLGLYASMAYGMSRGTYSGVEVSNVKSGANMATLPHLYSGTQQLQLLRSLLLYEEGDTLVLGQGIARPWLADGKHVRVTDAETTFGTVSYTIESKSATGSITATVEPPTQAKGTPIRLRIRHPDGAPIKSVTVNGTPATTFTQDTVELKDLTGSTTVECKY